MGPMKGKTEMQANIWGFQSALVHVAQIKCDKVIMEIIISDVYDNIRLREQIMFRVSGLRKGEVKIEHFYGLGKTRFILAHGSRIVCLALTNDGKFLATASTKGTLVRVYNTLDGLLLQEDVTDKLQANDFSMLPEAHACTAGLKSLTTSATAANVYHATRSDGQELAIKVYKTSVLVFKDRYVQGDYRFRYGYCRHNPRKMVKTWAEKEMRNLMRGYKSFTKEWEDAEE
ncbi:hypothetical protein AgCh_021022 [Apium graveolens]